MKSMLSLAAGLTAAVALSTSAFAADIPMRAPIAKAPAAVVVAKSWTGCYIGAGAGYGMWNQENQPFEAGFGPLGPVVTAGGRGWFGTAQAGCDYQISPNFVIGIFGDYDFSDLEGTPSYGVLGTTWFGSETQKWAWSVGGRIGYLITPNVLGYFSGGYTQARYDQVNLFDTTTLLSADLHVGATTYSGWYLGSGYEYAISFLPGLFWKTEYRFAQYQAESNPLIVTSTGLPFIPVAGAISVDSEKYVQTIRSQLVWRFGWR